VRDVHLQPLVAGVGGAAGGVGVAAVQALDLVHGEFVHREGMVTAGGDGRGADGLPAVRVVRREGLPAALGVGLLE